MEFISLYLHSWCTFIKQVMIDFRAFIRLVYDLELTSAHIVSYVFCVSMRHYECCTSHMTFRSCLKLAMIITWLGCALIGCYVDYRCDFIISYLFYIESSPYGHSSYYFVIPSMLKLMTYAYMFMSWWWNPQSIWWIRNVSMIPNGIDVPHKSSKCTYDCIWQSTDFDRMY